MTDRVVYISFLLSNCSMCYIRIIIVYIYCTARSTGAFLLVNLYVCFVLFCFLLPIDPEQVTTFLSLAFDESYHAIVVQ